MEGLSTKRCREAGFTLPQLIGAVVILLTLAFVLPASFAMRLNNLRVAQAEREARVIAEGIQRFERVHGFLPAWIRARFGGPGLDADAVNLLVGPGEAPKVLGNAGWVRGPTDNLANQLIQNSPGYGVRIASQTSWRGPYLLSLKADPWQNRYTVNIGAAVNDDPTAGDHLAVFVLSAGPNGIVETPYRQPQDVVRAGGDDIAVRVR